MLTDGFHPALAAWFRSAFAAPTAAQSGGWPLIRSGKDTLIAAPTGSGKTLAAFLAAIDDLVVEGAGAPLSDETRIVYVSPLKALVKDVERNLRDPLDGVERELAARGARSAGIRIAVRTGDTPAAERARIARRPPHILATTPESLYILLTSERGRSQLATVRTVIVDEIHALAPSKRGAHLALSLERLDALTARPPQRIGLSATQRPTELVGKLLVGSRPPPSIVDEGHRRTLDLTVEVPPSPLEAVMSNEVWEEVYDLIAQQVRAHRTTLVFVNTRRLAERVTMNLARRLGEDRLTAHHGSLSRDRRELAEARLKAGDLSALVATSSLELGIDVGSVDLVCQIGSTRSIATLLQRVGRSGHSLERLPKGRLYPTSRDELVECAALLAAVGEGALDTLEVPNGALDILAQQVAAETACAEWTEDGLFDLVRRAYPYRDLTRADFDAVMAMLADGFSAPAGRRGALVHRDRVNGLVRGRRGTRLTALTSGGAIPDTADYDVVLEPGGTFLGTVNEDFAVESMAGDVFQLGHASWRITRLERGSVRVADAEGQPPSIPFWLGEAGGRTGELSAYVSKVRSIVADRSASGGLSAAVTALEATGLSEPAAQQIADYLVAGAASLGAMPTANTLVAERFFDENGSTQMVIHSPLGSRINRAWGLALRKRFCRQFNFELQAAATEDAILMSLGPTHSFPLEEVFTFLRPATARDVLVQALLDAPMFATRWRWNAGRSLALPRRIGGKRVAPQLLRMRADDLIAVVFPDQLACLENIQGEREIPDHPLVRQTIDDCLHEAMDVDGFEALVADLAAGTRTLVARDVVEPSPFALEVLAARPYAFLDDAPLEERRAQAVQARRWRDPASATDLGALDPSAIEQVCSDAWPLARTADEVHEALVLHAYVTQREATNSGWDAFLADLASEGRAAMCTAGEPVWIAAERLHVWHGAFSGFRTSPPMSPTEPDAPGRSDAVRELLRGRLEALGPVTAAQLNGPLGLASGEVLSGLAALEAEGAVMRGRFRPGAAEDEWCERRLLARIHRATLGSLRQQIRPVEADAYIRFLLEWQRLTPDARVSGLDGLVLVMQQLIGFEAAAAAWEAELLPARTIGFASSGLDELCSSGSILWGRLRPGSGDGRRGPTRATPIAFTDRAGWASWRRAGARNRTADPVRGAALSTSEPDLNRSADARLIAETLQARGDAFFGDIVERTRLLPSRAEAALGELVAAGVVSADSFRGLRALLVPSAKRPSLSGRSRSRGLGLTGIESAGRWFLLPGDEPAPDAEAADLDTERIARGLLRRYGVVFRAVLARESGLPPWRSLLYALRRLEARGEIRGGRFVAAFGGEQFALPEAVAPLRRARERSGSSIVAVSCYDPANLVGIVTPGERLAAQPGNRLVYAAGEPVAVRVRGAIQPVGSPSPSLLRDAEAASMVAMRHKTGFRVRRP